MAYAERGTPHLTVSKQKGAVMHNDTNDSVTIKNESLPFQQIPNWILESDISAQAIRLYLLFQKYGNNKTKVSFWSRKKMAAQMSVSPATMDRAKKELIDIGALCQINRFTEDENWTSNMYHVHWDKNTNCKVLIPGGVKNEDTHTVYEEPPLITGDELTNNHLELRTNELSTRTYGDEEIRLANLLAELIIANGSKKPKVTKRWYSDIEKLHRIDGRSYEQIEAAIKWSQNDSFWVSNIQSPGSLRAKYDQMRLQAQRGQKQSAVTKTLNWLTNINWDEQKEIGK